ncbi:MAG TPA: hypothetical protein VLK84_00945 [Longimicrobium sp.]|nr:hypothetical protein [Longimicrobium sp.]
MTSVFVIALVLAVAGWTARLWVLANRAEHLVVLRLDAGTFLLDRQPDGRFLLISPLRVPAALGRFEVQRTVERYHAIRTALVRPIRWGRAAAHLH